MKHAPLRGLRCFPRESTGRMSGKCGWAFDMANLPGRSDVTRPVCADTALAASMHSDDLRRYSRGPAAGDAEPVLHPGGSRSGTCGARASMSC
jgi:hypothetical protein